MAEMGKEVVQRLTDKATKIRKDLVVYCNKVGFSHMGGPLSMCDVAVALYYQYMRFDPKNYKAPDRDRFILSKGHCACLLYNIFTDMGLFTKEQLYGEYNRPDGRFGQHPNRMYLPMFEASTGSLGHGLSLAFGYALGGRSEKADYRVFCVVGDGELDEGSNWEAIMAAANYKLGNLTLIVDRNRIMGCRPTEDTIALEPLGDKLKAFNWDVVSIDGNDMAQVAQAFASLPERNSTAPRKPIAIIANTVKGKGVSFMENDPGWHLGGLDDAKMQEALDSIDAIYGVRR